MSFIHDAHESASVGMDELGLGWSPSAGESKAQWVDKEGVWLLLVSVVNTTHVHGLSMDVYSVLKRDLPIPPPLPPPSAHLPNSSALAA